MAKIKVVPASDKMTVEFRGESFEVDRRALRSVKVLRALAGAGKDADRGYWAIDKVFCGDLDGVIERLPEEDGTVSDLGASEDALGALLEFVAAKANAKK